MCVWLNVNILETNQVGLFSCCCKLVICALWFWSVIFYVSHRVCWRYSRGDSRFIVSIFFQQFAATVIQDQHENSRAFSSSAGWRRRCRSSRRRHRSFGLHSRRDLLLHAVWTKLFCKVHALPDLHSRQYGPSPPFRSKFIRPIFLSSFLPLSRLPSSRKWRLVAPPVQL